MAKTKRTSNSATDAARKALKSIQDKGKKLRRPGGRKMGPPPRSK